MTCGDIDLGCTACRLSGKRLHVVPGNGPCRSRIMFVGEAPGKEEDVQGEPFVGRAGRVLDEAIEKAGANRSQVYVGNIVKCRPPNNRKPRSDEIETCASLYLESEIRTIRPTVICALGQTAANYFLPTKEKMSDRVRGEIEMLFDGIEVRFIVAYHPAACLYQRKNLASFERSIHKCLGAAGMI
jgi:uracil-DNA glycosylase